MKLLMFIAVSGFILFFPLNIDGSACLFGYLSGLRFATDGQPSVIMLNHYMRCFALPWWFSIALAIWIYKKMQSKKTGYQNGGSL